MPLTGDHIRAALKAAGAGGGLQAAPETIASMLNDAMTVAGAEHFGTVERVAALVSECMMESAYFRVSEEYAKDGRYAPFIGRTWIQLTWKANYAAFGAWCQKLGLVAHSAVFTDSPRALANLRWAALGGVYYFTQVKFRAKDGTMRPLVEFAADPLAVGRAVNLGNPYSVHTPNGQRARDAAYRAVQQLGATIIPEDTMPLSDSDVDRIAKRTAELVLGKVGDEVWNADVIPNSFTSNAENVNVSPKTALSRLGQWLRPAPVVVDPAGRPPTAV